MVAMLHPFNAHIDLPNDSFQLDIFAVFTSTIDTSRRFVWLIMVAIACAQYILQRAAVVGGET